MTTYSSPSRSCPKAPNSTFLQPPNIPLRLRARALTDRSNHSEQLWIWNLEGDRLFYDNHEMVRFQVVDEEWHDQTPVGPQQNLEENPPKAPYRIKGSMAKEGLGVCLWWDG